MIEILFISILERPVAFAVRHAYAAKRHGGLSGRPGSRSIPKGHSGHLPGNRKIGAVPRSGQRRALGNTHSPVPEDHFSNASKNSPQLSPPPRPSPLEGEGCWGFNFGESIIKLLAKSRELIGDKQCNSFLLGWGMAGRGEAVQLGQDKISKEQFPSRRESAGPGRGGLFQFCLDQYRGETELNFLPAPGHRGCRLC